MSHPVLTVLDKRHILSANHFFYCIIVLLYWKNVTIKLWRELSGNGRLSETSWTLQAIKEVHTRRDGTLTISTHYRA